MAVDLKKRNVWMYTTEYKNTTFDENVKEGVIVSDTKTSTPFNWKMYYNSLSLDEKIKEFYEPVYKRVINPRDPKKHMSGFVEGINIGDYIISRRKHSFIEGIGVVEGEYEFIGNRHIRKVKWISFKENVPFEFRGSHWRQITLIKGDQLPIAEKLLNKYL